MIDKLKYAELHLGILINRLEKIKKQMSVCTAKITMKAEGTDIDAEELKYKNLNMEYSALDEELTAFEDKVLKLTNL